VPTFVLTVLKVVFLALLYFFIWRALRSVAVDLRGTAAVRPAAGPRTVKPARNSSKPPRELVVLDEGGTKLSTVRLSGQINIGRGDACQVQVPDTYVSTFHARIFDKDGSWYVEDLGSTNGTYLNQRKVTAPAELRAGDRLRVGKTTVELRR
jgi:pSer/pThr/pTyr-binding forkhead associated (FHA) protein